MIPTLRILIAIHFILHSGLAADVFNWEAKIPPGAETNPIALNIAFGAKEIPNRGAVERLQGAYEVQPYAFSNLVVKVPGAELCRVAVRRDYSPTPPPDMAGVGPFYLVKAGTNFFALTETNFARAFGPVTNRAEVFPYLSAHHFLFGNPFGRIVTGSNKGLPRAHLPQKRSSITPVEDGFRVELVVYTDVHVQEYYEVSLHVSREGHVKILAPAKTLLHIDDGIVF